MAESPIMRKIREAKEARERAEKGGAAEPPKQEEAPPVQAQQEEKPAETKTEPPKIEAPKAASESGAPWYQDGCKACSGGVVPGFNPSTKAPCNICKVRSKKNGGPVPDDYDFDIGEGEVVFVHKETGEEIVRQIVAEEATSKQSAPAEKPAAKEEPPAETVTGNAGQPSNTPAKPAPAPEPPLNQEPLGPKTESAALFADAQIVTEREKFELIIEASIVEAKSKGGGKLGSPSCVITGEELHAMVISHLSAVIGPAGGPAGWHGVDPWKRKDAIRMYGREIADMCGSSTVVFGRLPRASELEVIVEAIRPYARRVIQALAG